eukprot:gene1212-22984_t
MRGVLLLAGGATALSDLQRSRAKLPRKEYKGQHAYHMGDVLNGHITRSHAKVKPCHEWISAELQEFQTLIFP